MVKKTTQSNPAATKKVARSASSAPSETAVLPTANAAMLPFFSFRGDTYHRLQGVEKYVIGSRHLFFANNDAGNKVFGTSGVPLDGGEWFATGTLRNSLYIEPLAQLTNIRDLSLLVDFEGALNIRLMCAVRGRPTEILHEARLVSASRTRHLMQIGSPTDLPENCRIFWHVDALPGGCTIFDTTYCTRTPPASTRLAVLLRTFGRTTDVKALLKRFANAGLQDAFYASILDNMDFWVLDTTAGAETEYTDEWADSLHLRVLVGPNLGGGGNAGHMLKLFDDHCRQSAQPPNELLILDDDLSLTMESLARYYMFAAFRAQEFICSLPIMMKSRPLTVWEDGGFWGRLNFQEGGNFGRQRNLFPNLLKHGTPLSGYDHLDDFGPLNTCEYSTFIFFGLSMKSFRKIGYPASFFLRGDDIELSLRANEAGLQMITNPNLAAWHEPAHSYGQEYMAILHGIIINLTYSDSDVNFYARFFEERLYEHASLNDLTGLGLYKDVLAELLNPDSLVLTDNFQQHYLPKLKQLGSAKFMKIPEHNRDAFEHRAREAKTLLVPFVYPGYQKDASKARNVVLINHSANAYRELPPVSAAERTRVSCEFLTLIARLIAEFDSVKARWQNRLKACSQESYWAEIQHRYRDETREVYSTRRNAAALFARLAASQAGSGRVLLSGAVSDSVISKGRAALQQMAARAESRSQTASTPAAIAAQDANGTIKKKPAQASAMEAPPKPPKVMRSSVDMSQLPSDFDPEYYLVINADVKAAGHDPVVHYLNFGKAEGRIYKA